MSNAEKRAEAAGIAWENDAQTKEFLTIIPEGDEENIFTGATLDEALDEAESYQEIKAKPDLYDLEFNERTEQYAVEVKGLGTFEHAKLHKALQAAKKAYMDKAKADKAGAEAPQADEPAAAPVKGRRRKAAQPEPLPTQEPTPEPEIRKNPEDRQPERVVEKMAEARKSVLEGTIQLSPQVLDAIADGLLAFSTAARLIANSLK